MVLIYKRIVFAVLVLFINTPLVFGSLVISGLVQYGENIDRDRLELLEDRQIIQLTSDSEYFITGIYIIRNSGEEYMTTLGVLFNQWQGDFPSPNNSDIKFFVNSQHVSYTEIINPFGVVAMGGNEKKLFRSLTAWALIDVLFPGNSIVTIKIQYKNSYTWYQQGEYRGYYLSYNPKFLSYFPKLLHWSGSTKFSVEVINDFIERDGVEYHWVSDIVLEEIADNSQFVLQEDEYARWISGIVYDTVFMREQNVLRTSQYLSDLQALETDLMKPKKINENTFRIDFTEKFINNYTRSFVIDFNVWTGERGAYIRFVGHSREIVLAFLTDNANISQRKLATYELFFLSNNQLRIIRNAFFARHGFIFRSREIQNMFDSYGVFYEPNPEFHEGMLTEIDRANIAIIQRLEALGDLW